MYEAYFGLKRRPFSSVPRVDDYFPAAAIEAARQTLVRCVERAEGVGMVIGPTGSGKTLLCQLLAAHFRGSFQVALLLGGRLSSPRSLLQAILFDLGQPYRGMDEGELRLALVDYLAENDDCPRGMVLIVDEAHTLPLRLLEEIRIIANLVAHGRPKVRPVLVGGPTLEERLASPKLDSFHQQIVARCYLESFDRAETEQCICCQLRGAGATAERVFNAQACHAVYQATDGIPRLVNQLCDHALVLAYAAGRRPVDRDGVEEAWADLQQLPTPWNDDGGRPGASGVIEFGGLDDGPEDARTAKDDSPVAISMLRLARDCEDSDDPAEQVTKIQRAIDELEEDFQPAGSIGPEIELFFDPSVDPFAEEFEEEEVITDRVTDPGPTAAAPGRTADGSEASGGEPSKEPDDECSLQGESVPEAAAATATATADAAASPRSETIVLHQRPAAEHSEPNRAEPQPEPILIIEDGYDDDPAATRPPPAARRREYSRLFSTLRGSC